jgi:hypothetical protein
MRNLHRCIALAILTIAACTDSGRHADTDAAPRDASADGANADADAGSVDAGTLADAGNDAARRDSAVELDAEPALDAQPAGDAEAAADARRVGDAERTRDGELGGERDDARSPDAALNPCPHLADGWAPVGTVTDPLLLKCMCGVPTAEDPNVILDTGNRGGGLGAVYGEQTVVLGGSGWSLWDVATRLRIRTGNERLLYKDRSLFLTTVSGDLLIRSVASGDLLHTIASTALGSFTNAGIALDGTYIWTTDDRYLRAFELGGTRWLETEDIDNIRWLVARPEGIYVPVSTGSQQNMTGYLRRYNRSAAPLSTELAVQGNFAGWFSDYSHFQSADSAVHIYTPDGVHVRAVSHSDDGVGDFYEGSASGSGVLYRLSSNEALTPFQGRVDLTDVPWTRVYFDAAGTAVYKLVNTGIGTWSGSPVTAGDPLRALIAAPSRLLGCSAIQDVHVFSGGRMAIVLGGGFFLYDVLARQMLSYQSLASLSVLKFSRNGATFALRTTADSETLRVYALSASGSSPIVDLPLAPGEFSLSPNGRFLTLATGDVHDLSIGSSFPTQVPPGPFPMPPAINSAGTSYGARTGGCYGSSCSSRVYQNDVVDILIGTVPGMPLEWLDDNTIAVQRDVASLDLYLHRADGTLAYDVTWPASARTIDPFAGDLGLQPRFQPLSAVEIYLPRQGLRRNYGTAQQTEVPIYRTSYAVGVAAGHAIYALGGASPSSASQASEVAVLPF